MKGPRPKAPAVGLSHRAPWPAPLHAVDCLVDPCACGDLDRLAAAEALEHADDGSGCEETPPAMTPETPALPVHERCGLPYRPGERLVHLQTACPIPPTEAELCAFVASILERRPP